ncbi:hypothetical protein LXL04_002165 [Taraxacum kok-saghyz]
MKSRFFTFLMIMAHILSAITCRPLSPNGAVFIATPPHQGTPGEYLLVDQLTMDAEQSGRMGESRMGSNPPSCEHKCDGCSPCEAIQVPTVSGYVGLAIQDSNYEPESWKCKCGRTIYSP